MVTYTVEKAQISLSELLAEARKGKTVLIAAKEGWAVKLVPTPIKAKKPRKAGSARRQVWMADDFDAPLQDFADYM